MPGIQITVSPALRGSSHLVQIVSVQTVPYIRAPSRDQPFCPYRHRLPYVGEVAGVIVEVSVGFFD
jgi:hypothetical protein